MYLGFELHCKPLLSLLIPDSVSFFIHFRHNWVIQKQLGASWCWADHVFQPPSQIHPFQLSTPDTFWELWRSSVSLHQGTTTQNGFYQKDTPHAEKLHQLEISSQA